MLWSYNRSIVPLSWIVFTTENLNETYLSGFKSKHKCIKMCGHDTYGCTTFQRFLQVTWIISPLEQFFVNHDNESKVLEVRMGFCNTRKFKRSTQLNQKRKSDYWPLLNVFDWLHQPVFRTQWKSLGHSKAVVVLRNLTARSSNASHSIWHWRNWEKL